MAVYVFKKRAEVGCGFGARTCYSAVLVELAYGAPSEFRLHGVFFSERHPVLNEQCKALGIDYLPGVRFGGFFDFDNLFRQCHEECVAGIFGVYVLEVE